MLCHHLQRPCRHQEKLDREARAIADGVAVDDDDDVEIDEEGWQDADDDEEDDDDDTEVSEQPSDDEDDGMYFICPVLECMFNYYVGYGLISLTR